MMTCQELVLPSTSARKQPLSYAAYAKEALEDAKQAYANFLVSRLVDLYNASDRELSFESWLIFSAKTLGVLAGEDSHEEYQLRNPELKNLGIDDSLIGVYIRRRLSELARAWKMPELARLKLVTTGFSSPLRFTRDV